MEYTVAEFASSHLDVSGFFIFVLDSGYAAPLLL